MHILKQKPMEVYILFKRILNGNNLRQSKSFTNVGYVFNLIVTSMVYIYKYINRYSFHPFIQNVLHLILDAHVFLRLSTHSRLRALQNNNVFRFFQEENLEKSNWPLRQTHLEKETLKHYLGYTSGCKMALS